MDGWGHVRARREGGLEAMRDTIADQREILAGMLDVNLILLARMRQDAAAVGALQRVTDELAAFELRCQSGDIAGAVAALRNWIERHT